MGRAQPITISLLAVGLLLVPHTAASFSLNTVVQDYWYYVGNHLASTTSAACEAAYATPINCDETLLGLVSSGDPGFNTGPSDFESMCVSSCSDSLASWVSGVNAACDLSKGDAALVEGTTAYRPEVPVAVVGEIFQYEFAWACSKNSSGWCYINYPIWPSPDFDCGDQCAKQLYANAHNYPGSAYVFLVYDLNSQSSWWENEYQLGWDRIVECSKHGTISIPPSSTVASSYSITSSLSSFPTTTTESLTPSSTQTTSSDVTTGSISPTSTSLTLQSASPTATPNAAGQVKLPSLFFGQGGWI
ncbi:hypothetical protein F5Y16DRAFT_275397 [Xylariaceae sp. FL0255]|nr:hypothetical protein F5Y16DRAFT_275397 [Xylariaceae sp. FL0255]